jgi:xylulokinase
MSRLFLGLDASTQSLSAIVIDYDDRKIIYERSLNFDETLARYGTRNGVLANADPLIKHSPPLMWVEALETLFNWMKTDGVPLGKVLAVSGSGQQHGSVYLNETAADALAALNPKKRLTENVSGIFSRPTAPIWMDSSTSAECAEIRRALGGLEATARLTGSDASERFTGPQIRKFHKTEPQRYTQTAHIALVSSFMASLLAGKIAPIDHGDGAGMNLMDIKNKSWNPDALKATAPRLNQKLPELAESWSIVGPVSSYFTSKFGLNPDAQTLVWSGDNPCSVIGLGLVHEGMVAISLGTSDTFFGSMKRCRTDVRGEGHVFCSPTGDYMSLICFKNGSLAREKIRDEFALNWPGFNQALAAAPVGNRGGILLPWYEPEIVPRVKTPGVHRFDLAPSDAAANCRAVVEAQMMAMRLHSKWMKVAPKSIYATGGASQNPAILQIMANVMNCPVLQIQVSKSAALGAALRAAHGWLTEQRRVTWEEVTAGFTEPLTHTKVRPQAKATRIYDKLVETYSRREQETVSASNP